MAQHTNFKNDPLYSRWVTLKHRYKVAPEWETFDMFKNFSKPKPEGRYVLMPCDKLEPIGADNHTWVPESVHCALFRRGQWVLYKGITLLRTDWAYVLGVSPQSLATSIRKHGLASMALDELFAGLRSETAKERARDRIRECLKKHAPPPEIRLYPIP